MLMEEGSTAPGQTIEPPGKNIGVVEVDRDQARVELTFVMDERDRLNRLARMTAADRDRLADLLRDVETERDRARDSLAAATAEQVRLSAENERLLADLDAAGKVIARAEDEIIWLRAVTEQLALSGRGRDDNR
jgi:hypothetical protein